MSILTNVPRLKIQITLEGKAFAWADLKREYLRDPKKYEHAIKQANWIRLGIINGLLKNVVEQVDPEGKTFFRADGSTDLTSDYDVTITGRKKEDATALFNELFEDLFDKTSAEVWDQNAYGSSPIEDAETAQSPTCKGNFSCSSTCVAKTDRCFLISQLRFRNSVAVVANQHCWAIATILRNISNAEQEWLTAEIIPSTNKPRRLRRFYQKALVLHKENPLSENIHDANRKYAEVLQDIYKLRIGNDVPKNTQEFALEYANAESRAGWYAQEAYVTMGAFLHVVSNDQRKLDLAVSQDEYKDSFIENMSYVLHALQPSRSCSQSFVVAAKYIARASFAAKQVFEVSEDDIVKELDNLLQESVKVRAQREKLLERAAANENVEQPMIMHMKGVSCSKQSTETANTSRKEVLQWILDYLVLMF